MVVGAWGAELGGWSLGAGALKVSYFVKLRNEGGTRTTERRDENKQRRARRFEGESFYYETMGARGPERPDET